MANVIGTIRLYEILDDVSNFIPQWTDAPTYGTTFYDIPLLDSDPSSDEYDDTHLNMNADLVNNNTPLCIKADSGTVVGLTPYFKESAANDGWYHKIVFWMRGVPYAADGGNNYSSSHGIYEPKYHSTSYYIGTYAVDVPDYGIRLGMAYYNGSYFSASYKLGGSGPYIEPPIIADTPEPTFDKTAFLSGMAMGLIGKGDPTFTGGGASGNMLYNGVELPDINTVWTDKATYPYAYIRGHGGDEFSYELLFATQPFLEIGGGAISAVSENGIGTGHLYYYDSSEKENGWLYDGEFEGGSGIVEGFTDLWASHDILYYADNTVYLAASTPVPAGGTDAFTKGYLVGAELRRKRVIPASTPSANGDGYALYNGVKLPNIDSVWTDKEKKPYAVIATDDNIYFELYFASSSAYVSSNGTVRVGAGSGSVYGLTTDPDEAAEVGVPVNVWVLLGESDYAPDGALPLSVLWNNHNILNADGSTYLASSDPISLDGYTVIEWDGNTEGLESINGTYYKISPDVPPVSAGDTVIVAMDTNVPDTPRYAIDTAFNAEGYTISTLGTDEAAVIWGSGEMGTGLFFFNVSLGERYARTTLFAYKA